MKRLVPILLCVLAICGCGRRAKVIPDDTLSRIYADMLLQDQWIAGNAQWRRNADTSLVYDHIFAEYGYTFEDYNASVEYYIRHPKKFEKLLMRTNKRMEAYAKRLEKVDQAWKDRPKDPVWPKIDFDTIGAKVQLDTTFVKTDSLKVKE